VIGEGAQPMMPIGNGTAPALALGLAVGSPATEQLQQVIAHAMAPAFLLGAVGDFGVRALRQSR